MSGSSNTNAVNFDDNKSYFPSAGGLGDQNFYCDSSQWVCPGIYKLSAVAFWQKGNRLAIKIAYYDDAHNLTWVKDPLNEGYFHISKDDTYATLSPLSVPSEKVLRGLQLVQNGNQVGYKIYVSNSDGTNGEWLNSDNKDYWAGSMENIYADLNSVVLGENDTSRGFQVWKKGNRMAPSFIL